LLAVRDAAVVLAPRGLLRKAQQWSQALHRKPREAYVRPVPARPLDRHVAKGASSAPLLGRPPFRPLGCWRSTRSSSSRSNRASRPLMAKQ
jgi:hypothetical protein